MHRLGFVDSCDNQLLSLCCLVRLVSISQLALTAQKAFMPMTASRTPSITLLPSLPSLPWVRHSLSCLPRADTRAELRGR